MAGAGAPNEPSDGNLRGVRSVSTEVRDVHVLDDLSAYLDGELSPVEQARVEAHLDTCPHCHARLDQLRAAARLVAALPSPQPSRSLVPRVTERWNGLRLVRSISAIATGAFLFAFLLTAVGRGGTGLGGGDASTAIFGGNGASTAAASAAPAAASLPTTAAPTLPPFAAAPAPAATRSAVSAAQSPVASPAEKGVTTAAPQLFAPAPSAAASGGARELDARSTAASAERPRPLLQPLFWLALAVLAGLAALLAHLRLRTR